ncbi:MAG: histidinol-phosphate transaminase [Candidatus Hydrothermarchaeales archaeon]
MIEDLIRREIREIAPYIPGNGKDAVERGVEAIKLASNENPFGPSEGVVRALKEIDASAVSMYPSSDALELRAAISEYVGVREEQVLVGNGSDEVLDLVAKLFLNPGEKAIIPIPTFSLYESIIKLYSGHPVYVPFSNFEFKVDGILESIDGETKIVFICSPNNPTGSVISRGDLERILEKRVVVILDEAYAEFAERSNVDLLEKYENLVVLRTFSKAFGLAGLRIGYGVARAEVVQHMLRIKPPFNVNALAQRAAVAALRDKKHLRRTIHAIREGRTFLYEELSKVPRVDVYPSQGNFLLVNMPGGEHVADELLKMGIVVRDCSSFRGLSKGFFRVSIGKPTDNRRFLECLRKVT